MSKRCRLFFLGLLFLCCNLGLVPSSAQCQGDQTRTSPTVQTRRQDLSELMRERDRLRGSGEVPRLIQVSNRIGSLHLSLRDLDSAVAAARNSLALARQLKFSEHGQLLVDTLVFSANVQLHLNSNQTAVRLLSEALDLSHKLKYRRGEAESLTELGVAYFQMSKLSQAESSNQRALIIWQELEDQAGEARTLTNQGETYMLMDRAAEATAVLQRAASIRRNLGSPAELATTLINLNFLAIRQGQWQQALGFLSEAQSVVTDKEAEPFIAGLIATSFGEAYEAYGQLEIALAHFREALMLYRDAARDKAGAIDAGSKVARVQARLGDYAEAERQLEEAMRVAKEIDDDLRLGLCHEELGRVWLIAGSNQKARQQFLFAIAKFEKVSSRRLGARAQAFLGQTEYVLGDLFRAADAYRKALRFFQNVQDYTNEAAVCFGLGRIALAQDQLDEAGKYLQRSIDLTEQLRENASSKDLRSSFLASVHDRYQAYIEWLMARHAKEPDKEFNVKAFEASELSRARSLLDSLKDYQRELRHAADPLLLLDEEKLLKQEQTLLDTKAKLISQGETGKLRASVENELVQVRARYEALQAQINSSSRFTRLLRPVPLTYEEIRNQVTDAETALLEYSLGSKKSYLWVVTSAGVHSYELPDKQTIEKAARKLALLLSKLPGDTGEAHSMQEAAAELSQMILSPVSAKLNVQRLIVVPDGILQYIPFQVLTDSVHTNQPFVANYEIINAPSASTLAALAQAAGSRKTGSKLIAAFGNPALPSNYRLRGDTANEQQPVVRPDELSDQQTSGDESDRTFSPDTLKPLFFAKTELNEIRKFGEEDVSVIYSEFDATRENLRKLDLGEYRILHFATHGFLNATQPELSGLALSLVDRAGQRIDGFVALSDIYNLDAPVDLVVLSACQTALGKDVRGEGLIGLTRGFMYAGASSVVASLWKVDDEATAELMKQFYGNMLHKGMTPAAALREAQNTIRQKPEWSSPHYWAAFTLQGEYRQIIRPPAPSRRRFMILIAFFVMLLVTAAWYLRRRYSTVKK